MIKFLDIWHKDYQSPSKVYTVYSVLENWKCYQLIFLKLGVDRNLCWMERHTEKGEGSVNSENMQDSQNSRDRSKYIFQLRACKMVLLTDSIDVW